MAQGLAAIGLAAIAFAVFTFDASSGVPGLAGLIPTGGAALVIAFARPGGAVASALAADGLPGLAELQRISVASAAVRAGAPAPRTRGRRRRAGIARRLPRSCSHGSAVAIRRAPVRDRRRFSRRTVLRGAAAASVLLAGRKGAVSGRSPRPRWRARRDWIRRASNVSSDRISNTAGPRERCLDRSLPVASALGRAIAGRGGGRQSGPLDPGRTALLTGDDGAGVYLGAGSTLPLPSALQYDDGFETAAAAAYENVFERIEAERPRVVLLQARWRPSVRGRSLTDRRTASTCFTARSTKFAGSRDVEKRACAALTADVARLASVGGTVLLLSAIPTLPHYVRRCYLDRACSEIDAAPLRRRNAGADAMLADIAAVHPNVFVEVLGLLCPEDACPIERGDRMLCGIRPISRSKVPNGWPDELLHSRIYEPFSSGTGMKRRTSRPAGSFR